MLHLGLGIGEALRDAIVVALFPSHEVHQRHFGEDILILLESENSCSRRMRCIVEQARVQRDLFADGRARELGGEWCMNVAMQRSCGLSLHRQECVQARPDLKPISPDGHRNPSVMGPRCPRVI